MRSLGALVVDLAVLAGVAALLLGALWESRTVVALSLLWLVVLTANEVLVVIRGRA
jgi:hypothetical protein